MLLSVMLGIMTCTHQNAFANDSTVVLYTTNTIISVSPGESVDYPVDVINNTRDTKQCNIRVTGVPASWTFLLKSGAYHVQQITILPGEKRQLSLKINVPLKVNKGNYRVTVHAGSVTLPLVINVSRQGSYRTEFTTEQANMQGSSKANFTFRTKLENLTGESQLYSLQSNTQQGWNVSFKPGNQPATSVEIEPNSSKNIIIEIAPPQNVSAGLYKIPVRAINNITSAELELEVVISGTFEIALTTPTGLVSTKVTAGNEKKLDLVVANTGSAALSDIELGATKPPNWEISFEPEKVARIEAGGQVSVIAIIKPDKKAIAGDYVAKMAAKSPDAISQLAFRISVKTPMVWGWIGILLIILSLGSIYFLVRKFGRR
jgi:uncharacterized membrane protein